MNFRTIKIFFYFKNDLNKKIRSRDFIEEKNIDKKSFYTYLAKENTYRTVNKSDIVEVSRQRQLKLF